MNISVFYFVAVLFMQVWVFDETLAQDSIIEGLELTQDEIDSFVDLHNDFRRRQNSSNIRLMSWDKEIAKIAETHSRKCTYAHSLSTTRFTEFFKILGENLYTKWSSSLQVRRETVLISVQKWYDEIDYYDLEFDTCQERQACGHYTQVVWSDSYKLGCGATVCRPSDDNFKTQYIVVCNYGVAGNYQGVAPYKEGSPCSDCSNTSDVCVTDLCANSHRGDVIPMQSSSTSSTPTTFPTTSPEHSTFPETSAKSSPPPSSTSSETPSVSTAYSTAPKTSPPDQASTSFTVHTTSSEAATTPSIKTTPPHTEEESTTPVVPTPTKPLPVTTPQVTFPSTTGNPTSTPIDACEREDLKEWRESFKEWENIFEQYVDKYFG